VEVKETDGCERKPEVTPTRMEVTLLSYTPSPQAVIYAAARQCYSSRDAQQIYQEREKISPQKIEKIVEYLIKKGHLSPLEHVSFTFSIRGISRTCSHQLVRHRIASFSQQSQRYVDMQDFKFIVPPLISKNKEAEQVFLETVKYIKDRYLQLKEILEKDKNLDKEKLNEDLRFILPQAVETKIVVTMNVRELFHFFSERLCYRAQWEIRLLANKMLALCKEVLPSVFTFAGPKCKRLKFCPEGYSPQEAASSRKSCPLFPKRGS